MSDERRFSFWSGHLEKAIFRNNVDLIKECFHYVTDVNAVIGKVQKKTPLEWAIFHNCLESVHFFIRKGASLDPVSSPDSFLNQCLRGNKPEIAKYLIQMGVDTCQPDSFGKTPLSYAITLENKELIELLLDHGAGPTVHTGLIDAAETNNPEMVRLLFSKGASVNCEDRNGFTPLLKCANANHLNFRVVNELIHRHADINQMTELGTPLLVAVQKGNVKMVQKFIQEGADVNVPGPDGWTPLMKALNSQQLKMGIVNALLKNGADVNVLTEAGTPLLKCIETGHPECFMKLLRYGADINQASTDGTLPVMKAIEMENFLIIQTLVDHRHALLNPVDASGDSPLLRAAQEAHCEEQRESEEGKEKENQEKEKEKENQEKEKEDENQEKEKEEENQEKEKKKENQEKEKLKENQEKEKKKENQEKEKEKESQEKEKEKESQEKEKEKWKQEKEKKKEKGKGKENKNVNDNGKKKKKKGKAKKW